MPWDYVLSGALVVDTGLLALFTLKLAREAVRATDAYNRLSGVIDSAQKHWDKEYYGWIKRRESEIHAFRSQLVVELLYNYYEIAGVPGMAFRGDRGLIDGITGIQKDLQGTRHPRFMFRTSIWHKVKDKAIADPKTMAELTELYEILIPLLGETEREIKDWATYPIQFYPYDNTVSAINKRLTGILKGFKDNYGVVPLSDQFQRNKDCFPEFLR